MTDGYIPFYLEPHEYSLVYNFKDKQIYRYLEDASDIKQKRPGLWYFIAIFLTLSIGYRINDFMKYNNAFFFKVLLFIIGTCIATMIAFRFVKSILFKEIRLTRIDLDESQLAYYMVEGKKLFWKQIKILSLFLILSSVCFGVFFVFNNFIFLVLGTVIWFIAAIICLSGKFIAKAKLFSKYDKGEIRL